MTECFKYRIATLRDLDAITRLGRAVNLLHHQNLPWVFNNPLAAKNDLEIWRESITSSESVAFVATLRDQIFGFVTAAIAFEEEGIFREKKICCILTMGVDPCARRKNVGRNLVCMVEGWARSQGADEIQLNVWSFNVGASRLYEKLGYAPMSTSMTKKVK